MDIVIAGAGIGGLTAALALHARGIRATVVESARELAALGVGINLLPHAVRELTQLGLGEDLLAISATPAVIDFYRSDGTLLFREPRGIEGGYGYPQCSVHRGRLQMLLLDAVRARLGSDAVRTGAGVVDFVETADAVHVQTRAGDFTAELFVGADGVHSMVRRRLHRGPDPLAWSGVRMFRGEPNDTVPRRSHDGDRQGPIRGRAGHLSDRRGHGELGPAASRDQSGPTSR